MDRNVTLYVNLVLYGLEPQNILYVFTHANLGQVDKLTYSYKNADEFFEAKKNELLNRLRKEALNKGTIPPTDIELGSEGVYISKGERKILPLFKEIQVKGIEIKLEDLVKKNMLNGNLLTLYICDTKRQFDQEYVSIFKIYPKYLLEKIALDCCDKEDINMIFEFMKSDERFFSIIRFLLRKGTPNELEEKFMTDIPNQKGVHQNLEKSSKLERLRYPYIDD